MNIKDEDYKSVVLSLFDAGSDVVVSAVNDDVVTIAGTAALTHIRFSTKLPVVGTVYVVGEDGELLAKVTEKPKEKKLNPPRSALRDLGYRD